jgi:hypothetical protein
MRDRSRLARIQHLCRRRPFLASILTTKPWVPHISLVFCEMWDTRGLDPKLPIRELEAEV